MEDYPERQSSTPSRTTETTDLNDPRDLPSRAIYCIACGGLDGRTQAGGMLCHDCHFEDDTHV